MVMGRHGTPSTVSRQPWRPTDGLYRDLQGTGGQGAGQGFRGRPGGQGGREIIEIKIYCLAIFARAPPRLGISVLYFDHFGRLFT